jgi:hypothetical protein
MYWRFPMPMTIRCYECGKVFDVVLRSKESNGYPCPACGKVEVFDLGEWERKAIAWNQNLITKGMEANRCLTLNSLVLPDRSWTSGKGRAFAECNSAIQRDTAGYKSALRVMDAQAYC